MKKLLSQLPIENISLVFNRLLTQTKLADNDDTTLIFYDLSHIYDRIEQVVGLFPKSTLHAIALKANPLKNILIRMKKLGVGLEAASLPELHLAIESGYSPEKIVFDSPVKTVDEIEYALKLGIHINVNSLSELDRVASLVNRKPTASTIGIRINPQVGTGSILTTSVAGEYSKFGVPLKEKRGMLFEAFKKYDWLTGVQLHIGSQGINPEMLVAGIDVVYRFVVEINELFRKNRKQRQINVFDMGGGFPVSYRQNEPPSSLEEYVSEIKRRYAPLFGENFKIITEFGRYFHVNAGWTASRVEYVERGESVSTAYIHVGADLLLRRCYRPEDWFHEISLVDPCGRLKSGIDKNRYVIAGPLCFAGDIIAANIELPAIEPGDYIITHDTGAYTLSMWSRYNSRQVPKVIGYENSGDHFQILKERESIDQALGFWM